jgi:predicted AlkP superfamily phosphohydrolase/phosphomutase
VYVALDGAIGEIMRSVGDDTTILIASGDGMCANYSGSHLLNGVLDRIDVLKYTKDDGRTANTEAEEQQARHDLLSKVRSMIPQRLRVAISQALLPRHVQEQLSLRWKTAGIAWPRTRAFVLENANEGYIRVNLIGREPQGTVASGAEYDELCEKICRTVRTMTNPATGAAAALAVHKTDDICDGPCRSHMPDIVIIWNVAAKVTTELLIEEYGLVRAGAAACAVAPFYSGNHWPHAFALAAGTDVPRGALLDGSILDLAPTILAQFGIQPPDYMDGRLLNMAGPGTE